MPFGGTLDTDKRWVIFSSLMPWEELEDTMPLVQSNHRRPSKACKAGVWCIVYHAEAWLERRGDRLADQRKCLYAVFTWL